MTNYAGKLLFEVQKKKKKKKKWNQNRNQKLKKKKLVIGLPYKLNRLFSTFFMVRHDTRLSRLGYQKHGKSEKKGSKLTLLNMRRVAEVNQRDR